MTRFDEGMTASAAGEAADLRTLGDLYCAANLAAAITLDVGRFGQWTEVVMRFMERTGHPDLLSFCGTCCAEVCRAAGQWEDGEGWLTRTLSQLQQSGRKARCLHPATRLASLPEVGGCKVTCTEDLTRLEGAPRMLRMPGVPRIMFRVSAKYMRRGFDGLLTLAEERGRIGP
jgi:hypothetical protein